MFMAALFTIAKLWKQPKCPSIYEWIKNMYLFSKSEIVPLSTVWMNLEAIILREVSQMDKDKTHMTSLIYGI